MTELHYTCEPPTQPGWYWCRNQGDRPGEMWEAIVNVYRNEAYDLHNPRGLCAAWMSKPGEISVLRMQQWSSEVEWAGPISPPNNSDTFRGRSVKSDGN